MAFVILSYYKAYHNLRLVNVCNMLMNDAKFYFWIQPKLYKTLHYICDIKLYNKHCTLQDNLI